MFKLGSPQGCPCLQIMIKKCLLLKKVSGANTQLWNILFTYALPDEEPTGDLCDNNSVHCDVLHGSLWEERWHFVQKIIQQASSTSGKTIRPGPTWKWGRPWSGCQLLSPCHQHQQRAPAPPSPTSPCWQCVAGRTWRKMNVFSIQKLKI